MIDPFIAGAVAGAVAAGFIIGRFFNDRFILPPPAPWQWQRQPAPLLRSSLDRYIPAPPPMPGMGNALDSLDEAARLLSAYIWSPAMATRAIRRARFYLSEAEQRLAAEYPNTFTAEDNA